MSIQDGHFRADRTTIESCCTAMDSFARTELVYRYNKWNLFWYPTMSKDRRNMEEVPICACPFCGAKLEWKKKDGGQ